MFSSLSVTIATNLDAVLLKNNGRKGGGGRYTPGRIG
jgi:hypothetical protein